MTFERARKITIHALTKYIVQDIGLVFQLEDQAALDLARLNHLAHFGLRAASRSATLAGSRRFSAIGPPSKARPRAVP